MLNHKNSSRFKKNFKAAAVFCIKCKLIKQPGFVILKPRQVSS